MRVRAAALTLLLFPAAGSLDAPLINICVIWKGRNKQRMIRILSLFFLQLRQILVPGKVLLISNSSGCVFRAHFFHSSISAKSFVLEPSDLIPGNYTAPEEVCIVRPGMDLAALPHANALYIFLFNGDFSMIKTLDKHIGALTNKAVRSVLADCAALQLLYLDPELLCPRDSLRFEVTDYEGAYLFIFKFVLVLGLGLFCGLLCYVIVKSQEKNDPSYDDFVISSANVQKYSNLRDRSLDTCSICFDEFSMDAEVRLLACGHYFHSVCVDRWLIEHTQCCPYCRMVIAVAERS